MQFVGHRAADTGTAGPFRAAANRLHLAACGRNAEIVGQLLDPPAESGRSVTHRDGFIENDASLNFFRCCAVDFGTGLAIGGEKIESDAGEQGGLAVFLRQLDVGDAEAAGAIGELPSKEGPYDELLPGFEDEGLIGPLALGVAEKTEKVERPLRGDHVEMKAAARTISEIAKMALAGETYPLARRYTAADDVAGILLGWMERRRFCFEDIS